MSGFNGNGIFSNEFNWTNDAANGIDILASRMDGQDGTIATGLSTCICRDGQSTTTAAITFAQGVTVSAGTLGTPSINIISDTDTGLAQVSGAGTMAFISNGSKILTFSGTGVNGPVGGTTAAAGAFTTISASGVLTASSTSTLTGAVTLGSTINKLTLTAPATGSTITITDGKTLKVDNTLEFAGTDSTKMTFPGTTDTVVTLTATQTLTNKTLTTAALGSSTATTQTSNDSSTKVATTAFVNPANSIGANGYQKLPSGLIIQWGITPTLTLNTNNAITFPLTFPTNCFTVVASVMGSQSAGTSTSFPNTFTASGFSFFMAAGSPATGAQTASWMAIGN